MSTDVPMPEADGTAEGSIEALPGGGYTCEYVDAWSEPLVRAYAAACVAAERERWAQQVEAMHEADDSYGTGFHNSRKWRQHYAELRRMCGMDKDVRRVKTEQETELWRLQRWKSTHAPRIEALEGLLRNAQLEAAAGHEAITSLASEREANATLTGEIERLSELLQRCHPIVRWDAQMAADITRHSPLDPESQLVHDTTETDSERLLRALDELFGPVRT